MASPIALDELLRQVRKQRVGRIVDDHARRTQSRDLLRPFDECVDLTDTARAVDEPDVELLAGSHDRLPRLFEIRDVVERIVKPEDVDPVPCCTRDEAAHDVFRHRT